MCETLFSCKLLGLLQDFKQINRNLSMHMCVHGMKQVNKYASFKQLNFVNNHDPMYCKNVPKRRFS